MRKLTLTTSLSSEADDTKKAPDTQSFIHRSDVATRTVFAPAATNRAACTALNEVKQDPPA